MSLPASNESQNSVQVAALPARSHSPLRALVSQLSPLLSPSSTAFLEEGFSQKCLEIVNDRRMEVDHTTIYRWVQKYSPEIDKRFRPHLRPTNDSWRVDETPILINGKQKYLYRAVDSQGNTLDGCDLYLMLSSCNPILERLSRDSLKDF